MPVTSTPLSLALTMLRGVGEHYASRSDRRRFWRLVFLLVLSSGLFGAYVWTGPAESVEWLVSTITYARSHPLRFCALLFLGWTCLFLTMAPLGSVTVMVAGFVFGPLIGGLQALAQLAASALLYAFLPRPTHAALEGSDASKMLRERPVLFVGLLRLVPVLPSAVSVIAYRELGISSRHMVLGTALVGWVRPVGLAYVASRLPDIHVLMQRLLA